jgi:two-component system NtrC family sensor kinase
LEVDCEEVPPVQLDSDQIKQVLLNLMINAGHAMPKGGKLEISARTENGNLVLAVKDTGAGIPQSDLDKIFDTFFTTKASGTGLGLSVCYRLVSDHGGNISVDSVPGEGTSVRIELPVSGIT